MEVERQPGIGADNPQRRCCAGVVEEQRIRRIGRSRNGQVAGNHGAGRVGGRGVNRHGLGDGVGDEVSRIGQGRSAARRPVRYGFPFAAAGERPVIGGERRPGDIGKEHHEKR